MNSLKKQILLLDADILITENDRKRVDAFQKIEVPAMFAKRNIDRIVHVVHNAGVGEYSDAVHFTLESISSLEKYIAELKKRCDEFKRIK